MSDYSAVAPPQNFQSSAFAAALQRAKQIAAKINPSGSTTSQKRPLEDGNEPDAKKVGIDNSGSVAAAAQAAAVAARVAGHGGSMGGLGSGPSLGPSLGGPVLSEDIKVPDKMVGLIIGRGGEQITRLQSESGCKIQMAPDSAGQPERVCSLAGTRDAINRAKELIMNIVHQRGRTEGYGPINDMGGPGNNGGGSSSSGSGGGGGGGIMHVEIMVPGPKVGLIIGKGGETIKQLQEKSGAKMVVIQDGPNQEQEKPLRITGEPSKVEYAKQLVYELIAEKEMQAYRGGRGGGGGRQDDMGGRGGPGLGSGQGYDGYGPPAGGGPDGLEVSVPRAAVGVVIGKGGDMIKKIQAETGARVQFQQVRDDGPGDRRCLLTGKPQHVEMARHRIEELIDSVIRRDTEGGGGGGSGGGGGGSGGGGRGMRGGGRNGGDRGYDRGGGGRNNGHDYNGGGGGGWGDRGQEQTEVTFVVPSNKCGVIIGKGGETIKQINQQSGAHCELDRRATSSTPGSDKTFVIRGAPDQVESCKRIVSEKVQMLLNFVCTSGSSVPQTAAYPGMAPQGYSPAGWGAPAAAYQQQWAPQSQQGPQEAAGVASPAQVQVNPQTGQPDYSLQWAEYYRSLGMHREAEMIEQQAKGKQTQPPNSAPTQPQNGAAPQPQPQQQQPQQSVQQPDYSAQWAEYYRNIGKVKEAEAIEAQMKSKSGGSAAPQAQQPPTSQPTQQFPPQQQYGAYGQTPAAYYPAAQQPQQQQQQQYGFPAYGYGHGQPAAPDN